MTIEIHQPELEALIRARIESGAFLNVEDLLMKALKTSPSPEQPARLLSECIALAETHGSTVTLDENFSNDLLQLIADRSDPLQSQWD